MSLHYVGNFSVYGMCAWRALQCNELQSVSKLFNAWLHSVNKYEKQIIHKYIYYLLITFILSKRHLSNVS
jgi:hypothetical protein